MMRNYGSDMGQVKACDSPQAADPPVACLGLTLWHFLACPEKGRVFWAPSVIEGGIVQGQEKGLGGVGPQEGWTDP